MKIIKLLFFGVLAIICTLVPGFASIASASTATATVESMVFQSIDASASAATATTLLTDTHGKQLVAFVHNPKHHYPVQKALHTPFAKNYAAGQATGQPFRLHKGQKYPTTWNDPNKAPVYSMVKVHFAWQIFVPEADGLVHNRGYYNGHSWKMDCDNPKPPVGVNMVPESHLHIVAAFHKLRYSFTSGLHLAAYVTGQVKVDCGSSSATATFGVFAQGDSSTKLTVVVKARSSAEAASKATAMLNSNTKLHSEATSALQDNATLMLTGAATATCTGGPPPVVYNPPSVNAAARGCVNQGASDGIVDIVGTNPNGVAAPGSVVFDGRSPVLYPSVAAGSTVTTSFGFVAPGTYLVTFTLGAPVNMSVTTTVTVLQCNTPPPTHWVQVSCTSPEELTAFSDGSGGAIVPCDVSADSGPISMTVHVNDSNSRVSGVICHTTGTSSCPPGGTFEFLWTGLSQGYTSVDVTVSANGVTQTITLGPIPVDPDNGGF